MAGLKTSWFWRDIRESLLTQPLKTGLTFMAVAVGMLALTLLLAILAGLEQRAGEQAAEIGADVAVLRASSREGSAPPLTAELSGRLRDIAPGSLGAGVRVTMLEGVFPFGAVEAISAEEDYPAIRGWTLAQGRWLDAEDRWQASLHAVISDDLAGRLALRAGDIMTVRETLLRVVGIARTPGLFIMVPPAAPVWWTGPEAVNTFDGIYIKNRTYAGLELLVERIRRDLEPGGPARTIITPDSLIASTRAMMRTVRWVYGSVAGLCLLLGGVTLSSLMTVSIQQRTGEIGLRLAIGASWRDIFLMFLCEGLLTTLAAGLAGLAAGLAALGLMGGALELPVAVTAPVIVLPVLVAGALGLLFSWLPAHTAASTAPAMALRAQ